MHTTRQIPLQPSTYRLYLSRETVRRLSTENPKDTEDPEDRDTRNTAGGGCCTNICQGSAGACTKNWTKDKDCG